MTYQVPDYVGTPDAAGTSRRRRSHRGQYGYALGQTPFLIAFESTGVVFADGTTVEEPRPAAEAIRIDYNDPAFIFPIRNPADDSDTGQTMTDAQFFAAFYSRVRAAQKARDDAMVAADATNPATPAP